MLLRALVVVGAAMLLGGCDFGYYQWLGLTGNNSRAFFYVAPCSVTRNALPPLESRRYYSEINMQELPRDKPKILRYEAGIAIEDGGLQPIPSLVTFLIENGTSRTSKMYVAGESNAPGEIFTYPETVGRNTPRSPTNETCAIRVRVPWQQDRNRPYWVADQTLRANPEKFTEASAWTTIVIAGLCALFAVGTGVTSAGYFDATHLRGAGLTRCLLFAALAVAVLLFMRWQALSDPIERLPQVQSFYSFYEKLPKANGYLFPLTGNDARRFFAGPPVTTFSLVDTDAFRGTFGTAALVALVVFLLLSAKRLWMGFYWVIVRHPAEPVVLPPLRDGSPIDPHALADVLMPNPGDLEARTPVYRSKGQAEKARAIKEKLIEDAEIAEAIERRERARAALMRAEREVEEMKRNPKGTR